MKKVAIVTGGSRGIGLAIVKQLAKDGFNVLMVATKPKENNQEVLNQLAQKGYNVGYSQANIGNSDDRKKIVKDALEQFGRIDVLVNNAGVAPLERNDLLQMTEESFDRVIGINTKGTMFLTQAVAKQMISQEEVDGRKGVIVNISSCSSVVSSTSRGEYCISKAGVTALTMLYADRLASEKIWVHEVRPGVIATDMTSTVEAKYNKLIDDGVFPIARWGLPEDVANVVSAFVSEKFQYTTGNYVDVDGGFHIQRL
ncbi:MAG TPA: 3-ketoacyl-ACP reductase [Erysipelotrichaceae bacterium]|jgi:3-oxoacyl-[acyl-carrier protein] reductase|nr:3-ketoacyl-ACP reductase [Erysipelotrichaceae bacterium]HQA84586.1 3-ketoacyl-ACP reductase [Erysipelotrichaceae bacterium]